MKIKKNTLKLIIIGSIFIFSSFNMAFLFSLQEQKISSYWVTYDIPGNFRVFAEEDEDDEKETEKREKSTEEIEAEMNKELDKIFNATGMNDLEENETKKETLPKKKAEVNAINKKTPIIGELKENPKTAIPEIIVEKKILTISDIGDQSRSVNGITGASIARESGDDKKTLSTVKYYSKGISISKDFNSIINKTSTYNTGVKQESKSTVTNNLQNNTTSTAIKPKKIIATPVIKPAPKNTIKISAVKPAPEPIVPAPISVPITPPPAPVQITPPDTTTKVS